MLDAGEGAHSNEGRRNAFAYIPMGARRADSAVGSPVCQRCDATVSCRVRWGRWKLRARLLSADRVCELHHFLAFRPTSHSQNVIGWHVPATSAILSQSPSATALRSLRYTGRTLRATADARSPVTLGPARAEHTDSSSAERAPYGASTNREHDYLHAGMRYCATSSPRRPAQCR